MRRFFARPFLSLFVLAVWLLLNQSVSPGQLLIGLALALFASFTMTAIEEPGARLKNPLAALRLLGFVLVEIVRSNIAVGRIVLSRRAERRAGFLRVRLELKDPRALAVLSVILTATPGSLWVDYDPASGELLLHVLDEIGEDEWQRIVSRYERRLSEIMA